jgi:hypothetical protein
MKAALLFFLGCAFTGTAYAQQCLHGPGENAEQAARRRDALTATRSINTIEARSRGRYLRQEELDTSPFVAEMLQSTNETMRNISLVKGSDVLPNWELVLDLTPQGYWFMIRDKSDPCGFAYVSNQRGLIYNAEVIR